MILKKKNYFKRVFNSCIVIYTPNFERLIFFFFFEDDFKNS